MADLLPPLKPVGIKDAALFASGVTSPVTRQTEKVETAGNSALMKKYQRWKEWFDGLLK